jgi:hypothetical protein
MRAEKQACRVAMWKPEGKRPLGRIRNRRKDNVKMVSKEIVWQRTGWVHVALDRDKWRAVVKEVPKRRFPQNSENVMTSWRIVSFSRTGTRSV